MTRFVPLALAAAIAALLLVAAGPVAAPADARPARAQALSLNGTDTFWVSGRCSGPIRVALYTDRAKPGRLTVKLTPGRFSRTCTVRPWIGWGMMGADQHRIPMKVGPRGGPSVSHTYRTNRGITTVAAGHRPSLTGISYYAVVP